MEKTIITRWASLGAFFAMLAVILGAFGAHALKDLYSIEQLAWHQTAVEYQMYHAFALIITGLTRVLQPNSRFITFAGVSFLIGIILFSGSLYLLAFTEIKFLGAITPIGGMAFISGWISLIFTYSSLKLK